MSDLRTNLQVPKNTQVVDANGQMTLEWQKYITQLQKTIQAAQEAIELIYMTRASVGDVRGASTLVIANSVPLISAVPGVLAQGPLGETSLTVTYLTGTPGTGQSSHTVTFSSGIEVSHT